MSADSATAIRRSTKRLRAVVEPSLVAAKNDHSDSQLKRQTRQRVQHEAEESKDDGEDDVDGSDDEAHTGRTWEVKEEEAGEQSADDSTMPPLVFHSTTAPSPLSRSSPADTSYLRVAVPAHRYSPLKAQWQSLYQPIVEHMKLQIRFNPKKRCVELRVTHSPHRYCTDSTATPRCTIISC